MTNWTHETVYHDGDLFFTDLTQALQVATKSIDLESYIFDRDSLGKALLGHLKQAAQRGLRVRLLLDGVGCLQWSYKDLQKLSRAGVHLRFFHPLPWQNPHYRFWRIASLRRIGQGLWKLNRRNHRKTCVIDGRIAFVGSRNISVRHLEGSAGQQAWRDTSVQIQGESVAILEAAFQQTWKQHRRALLRSTQNESLLHLYQPQCVRLNQTFRQRRSEYQDLVQKILQAQTRIWLTTPYFVPEFSVLRALRLAAIGRVDVRILVPKQGDVWGLKWAIRAFYSVLLAADIRIYEYTPSILHAKVLIIDGRAIVGSSNFNHRSILHDLELDVVLDHPSSLQALEGQFLKDLIQSEAVTSREWQRLSWVQFLLHKIALLFRRWL